MTTISETWIVTSGGPAPEVPDLPLPDFLLAGKAPDRPAIVDGPSGRGLTYGELTDGVRRVQLPSSPSTQANASSAKQRSSVSSTSARSASSTTGATSSTRVSRLRGIRSAEPM